MIDLSAKYLGCQLRSPLVASSSPLCKELDSLRRIEEGGAGAVVLHSLFEEQITLESEWLDGFLNEGAESYAEATSYFPDQHSYHVDPGSYMRHIEAAKRTLTIPVIGSLNGASAGGWIRYAKDMESAGADALELNIYYLPTSPQTTSADVEHSYIELVRYVKDQVRIPVAVKLPPYFTAMANMARQLEEAGADAVVLFNRFYQPDFDLDTLEVTPNLKLSTSDELRLRIHWVALLYPYVKLQLAITGGVHTAIDIVKGIMAGAQVVMLTSALLERGVPYLTKLHRDLIEWMGEREYTSIAQMRGSMSASAVSNPSAFMRANYIKVLSSYLLA
jgi:dihydroorotate dehydrogenase (fumarate)